MPSLHGFHEGRAAYLTVGVVDAARFTAFRSSNEPVLRGLRPFRALVDTGASATMITSKVVRQLGLMPVGSVPYQDLRGMEWRTTYLFNIAFYEEQQRFDDDTSEPDSAMSKTYVYTPMLTGAEIANEPSFDVLLGMDVITTGELRVSKDGTFSFQF